MRNVLFKKWLQAQREDDGRITRRACFEDDFTHEGVFHQWGVTYEDGEGSSTVAIVEDCEGLIHEVLPANVKFTTDTDDDVAFRDAVAMSVVAGLISQDPQACNNFAGCGNLIAQHCSVAYKVAREMANYKKTDW